MSDYEAQPGSNRNKNINNLSSALALELGLPTDFIEQAFRKVLERNSINDNLSLPNVRNSIQDSKLVDGLSQSTSLIDTDSEPVFRPPRNRKDSLSSLIEITQKGSSSINIKLPDLYIPPPTVQDSLALVETTSDENINSIDENLNQYGNILYSDEPDNYNISNNEGLTPETLQPQHLHAKQNQDTCKSSTSTSEEFIQPRRESFDENTPKSFMPEFFASGDSEEFVHPASFAYKPFIPDSEEDIQPKQRESLDLYVKQDQDPFNLFSSSSKAAISQAANQKAIKNKTSETYSSEWPSLSESAKKGDSKKNSEVDLGAWDQMNTNIASAWGKPKKWSSETETKPFEPPVTWNPDDVNKLTWKPIQEPKAPLFKKKKKAPAVTFEFDDNEGWGAPPTKYIPWDDSRQGYCVDLIEEQKETVFWTMQNGVYINVTEETKITQEKETVEYTSDGVNHKKNIKQTRTQTEETKITHEKETVEYTPDGVNHKKNIKQTRTQTQRYKLIEGIDSLEHPNWNEIREQTKRGRERLDSNRPNNEIGAINNNEDNIMIELSDHYDDENSDSNGSDIRSNSAMGAVPEGPRERLGNPQWKTEKEWDDNPQSNQVVVSDLIKFNTIDLSDSKSSEDDDEPLTSASDRDESAGEISNWDKMGSIFDNYPLIERSEEAILDIEPVKDDAWFVEDVMATNRNEQEEMADESEQNPLLINIDSNSDDATDATIINTHPPIFHGTVNNNIMADLNDFIFDSANISTNVDIINNSELNLLSFDDDEDNRILNSSDNIISIETQAQENEEEKYPHEFDIFLGDNIVTEVLNKSGARPSEVIEDSNELQRNSPALINQIPIGIISSPAKSYRDSENKGSANEPLAAADLDTNPTNAVTEKNYFISLQVETERNGRQELRLCYDDNPEEVIADFCKKWDMKKFEDTLQSIIQKVRKKKIRRRDKKMMIKNAKCMLNEE